MRTCVLHGEEGAHLVSLEIIFLRWKRNARAFHVLLQRRDYGFTADRTSAFNARRPIVERTVRKVNPAIDPWRGSRSSSLLRDTHAAYFSVPFPRVPGQVVVDFLSESETTPGLLHANVCTYRRSQLSRLVTQLDPSSTYVCIFRGRDQFPLSETRRRRGLSIIERLLLFSLEQSYLAI